MRYLLGVFLGIIFGFQLSYAEPRPGLYVSGVDSSPLIPLIESANRSIDLEVYTMTDEGVVWALTEAITRGVRVRIIKGLDNWFGPVEESLGKVMQVIDNGSAIVRAKPQWKESFEKIKAHGKLIVVDNQRALISSGNFNPENLCSPSTQQNTCFRDYSLVLDDPDSILILSEVFRWDFERAKSTSYPDLYPSLVKLLRSPVRLEGVSVGPFGSEQLVSFIDQASETLQIENQYITDPILREAIHRAAGRGVRVEITLSSNQEKKATLLDTPLERENVSIRLMSPSFTIGGKPAYLHAKAIVVDGRRGWIGSNNGSPHGMQKNREFGFFFDKKEWVDKLSVFLTLDHYAPECVNYRDSRFSALPPLSEVPNTVFEGTEVPSSSENESSEELLSSLEPQDSPPNARKRNIEDIYSDSFSE